MRNLLWVALFGFKPASRRVPCAPGGVRVRRTRRESPLRAQRSAVEFSAKGKLLVRALTRLGGLEGTCRAGVSQRSCLLQGRFVFSGVMPYYMSSRGKTAAAVTSFAVTKVKVRCPLASGLRSASEWSYNNLGIKIS